LVGITRQPYGQLSNEVATVPAKRTTTRCRPTRTPKDLSGQRQGVGSMGDPVAVDRQRAKALRLTCAGCVDQQFKSNPDQVRTRSSAITGHHGTQADAAGIGMPRDFARS